MKLNEIREGVILVADGGFTCLHEGQECQVKRSGEGLYVECSEGKHHLDGQVDFETGTDLVGFTYE